MPPPAPRTATLEAYMVYAVSITHPIEATGSIAHNDGDGRRRHTWLAEAEKARFPKRLRD